MKKSLILFSSRPRYSSGSTLRIRSRENVPASFRIRGNRRERKYAILTEIRVIRSQNNAQIGQLRAPYFRLTVVKQHTSSL